MLSIDELLSLAISTNLFLHKFCGANNMKFIKRIWNDYNVHFLNISQSKEIPYLLTEITLI